MRELRSVDADGGRNSGVGDNIPVGKRLRLSTPCSVLLVGIDVDIDIVLDWT